MTRVYLACSGNIALRGLGPDYPWRDQPTNVLVSYVYLRDWEKAPWARPARTMLDSGAFSAWRCGARVDIDVLTAETKKACWHESVALDVIGDADASLRNALAMKALGSPAYPVFHIGDPWEHLEEYTRQFPKVGLSCRFGEPEGASFRWLDGCFGRRWPHRFHSFGWVHEFCLNRFPFDSADTASWRYDPNAFGNWKAFGGPKLKQKCDPLFRSFRRRLKTRRCSQRAEVEYYLRLERYLSHRWRSTLAPVRAANPLPPEVACAVTAPAT